MPRVILLHGRRVHPETIRASIHGCKAGGARSPGRYGAADASVTESPEACVRDWRAREDAAGQHAPGKTLC